MKSFNLGRTALEVVAHAEKLALKGEEPVWGYAGESDPVKALRLAKKVVSLGNKTKKVYREEYYRILARTPIDEPSIEDIVRLCPHLTPDEAVRALLPAKTTVALPSIKVRGAFHAAFIDNVMTKPEHAFEGEAEYIKRLVIAKTGIVSAEQDGCLRNCQYIGRSVDYAETHWNEILFEKNWKEVVEIQIEDPGKPVNTAFAYSAPKKVDRFFITLKKKVDEISKSKNGPLSSEIDKYTVNLTNDPLIASEFAAGSKVSLWINCAICGGGLGVSKCFGCGKSFYDDGVRGGRITPLSEKQVNFLECLGHKFGIAPKEAQKKEIEFYDN